MMNYRSTSDLLSYTQGSAPYIRMADQPLHTYSKHMFFSAQASREVLLKCFTLLSKKNQKKKKQEFINAWLPG